MSIIKLSTIIFVVILFSSKKEGKDKIFKTLNLSLDIRKSFALRTIRLPKKQDTIKVLAKLIKQGEVNMILTLLECDIVLGKSKYPYYYFPEYDGVLWSKKTKSSSNN